MREYKQNITIPFITFFTYIFIIMMPILTVLWMIIDFENVKDAVFIIPYCLLVLIMLYILAEIVNLLGKISKKHIVKITDSKIIYEEKEIKYEFINKIILEKGFFNKYNKSNSSALILFNDDKVLLNIKNPSLRVIRIIKKRCKNIKFDLVNPIFNLIMLIIYGLLAIVLTIFMIIF